MLTHTPTQHTHNTYKHTHTRTHTVSHTTVTANGNSSVTTAGEASGMRLRFRALQLLNYANEQP